VKPADLLFTQGFGTRRACAALVAHGLLEIDGLGVVADPARDRSRRWFRVAAASAGRTARALVVLHKPAGHECRAKPRHHPANRCRQRPRAPPQAIGRLDETRRACSSSPTTRAAARPTSPSTTSRRS
jgi:16S rRNA pseudouridine516 synthase